MARLLFFTDSHLSSIRPKSRKDDYTQAILSKLEYVASTTRDSKADAVLCGGDFFDRNSEKTEVILEAKRIIESTSPTPWFFCIGQHEIEGYNRKTMFEGTSIGRLIARCPECEYPNFTTVASNAYYRSSADVEGTSIAFLSVGELNSADKDERSASVWVIHDMVVPKTVPWPHYLASSLIAPPGAKIILTGDYHSPFKSRTSNDVLVVNPGSLSRREITDANRAPRIILIHTDSEGTPKKVSALNVPHKSPEDAFRIDELEQAKQDQIELNDFRDALAEITLSKEQVNEQDLLGKAADQIDLGDDREPVLKVATDYLDNTEVD